jgi:hypothetical protein
LTAALLLAEGLWALGLQLSGRGLPRLALPAAGLPALALAQLVLGRSAAPVWTAEAVLVCVAMLGVVVFWSEQGRDHAAARRLTFALLGVAAVQAVFAVVQWSGAPNRIYGRVTPLTTMPFGSFVSHGHFAGLVEMAALLAAGMAVGHARREERATPASVALAGLSLALVAAHLASRSRGGLLALGGGACVLGVLWILTSAAPAAGSRRLPLAAAAGVVGLIGFGLAVIPSTARSHLATLLRPPDASGSYRIDVAGWALRAAIAHPLVGTGIGAFSDGFARYKRDHGEVRSTHAESDVLEFAVEGGLLGLLALGVLGWALLGRLEDRLVRGRDPFRKGIAAGAAAAAAAFLFHGLVDFNSRIPSNALFFASLLGLIATGRSEPRRLGSRATAGAAALCLILAAASAWRALGARGLDEALRILDHNQRIGSLDRLLDRHPYLPEAFRARGLAWRDLALSSRAFVPARLARAEQDLSAAARLRPHWAEARADLGWVHLLRGDRAAARRDLDLAIELDPTHLHVGLVRAAALAHSGDAAAAISELKRLRSMNPRWSTQEALFHARQWTSDSKLLDSLKPSP